MKEQPIKPGTYRIGTGETVALERVTGSRYLREVHPSGATLFYRQLVDGTYQVASDSKNPKWAECNLLRIDPSFLDNQDERSGRMRHIFSLLWRLRLRGAA